MTDWSNGHADLKYFLGDLEKNVQDNSAAGARFSCIYIVQEYKNILFIYKKGRSLYLPFYYLNEDIRATK